MKVPEAAKIIGVTNKTVRRWIEKGEIAADQVPSTNRDGWAWDIPKTEVLSKATELDDIKKIKGKKRLPHSHKPKEEKKEEEKEKPKDRARLPRPKVFQRQEEEKKEIVVEEKAISETTSSVKIQEAYSPSTSGNKNPEELRKVDVEKFLKWEQFQKERRKNLVESGDLVNIREVAQNVREIFSVTFEALRETVDKWGIELALPVEVVGRMHNDLNSSLKKCGDSLDKRVTKCIEN